MSDGKGVPPMKIERIIAVMAILSLTVLSQLACTKKPTDATPSTTSSTENASAKTGSSSGTPQSFPGAKGPRLERVGTPLKGIEITDVIVSDMSQSSSGAPPTQQFPSGTNTLHLDVKLKAKSPPKNKIEWELFSNDGKVGLKGAYGSTYAIPSAQIYSFGQTLDPESGTFPDGPYQLKLMMDGQTVAILNWSVGGK